MAAADQIHPREGDAQSRAHDGSLRILAEQRDTTFGGANQRATNAADSAALVQSHTLPDLQIGDHSASHTSHSEENGFMRFVHDVRAAAPDLITGAVNEVTQHPLQVLESAATGLAIGVVATLAAPEVVAVAAIGGVLYGGYELATHIGGWAHHADVVAHTDEHTSAEIAEAHRDLQNVGGGAALYSAGFVGALGAGPLVGTVSDALAGSAGTALESDIASQAAQGSTGTRLLEAPRAAQTEVAAQTEAVAQAEAAALTPEEVALQRSVAQNQATFAEANARGEVVQSVKQLYNVQFERVGPGGRVVPTLENPAGVQVPEGGWVATRLNADGTPNVENGIVNRWTPEPSQILKQYVVNPEQLESGTSFVAPTNTSAPPVAMVRLTEARDFQTPWGSMHAEPGDWLSNYDFDVATGRPGSDFARVTAESYRQTYEPVGE